MTDAPVIRTRTLTKGFRAALVLDAIDLSVAKGESLVIIGGSGAGKSVLIRTILGWRCWTPVKSGWTAHPRRLRCAPGS